MKHLILIILLAITAFDMQAQDERKFIREGNDHFTEENYLESEIEYRKALDKTGDSFEAQFNLGDALFKQEKYNDALEQFQILAGTEQNPDNLAKVYHNIGNSYFAMEKFPESIEAYKNALRNNPDDNESRYNLIAVQKMLKQQQQNKDKNQNKDQQQNQKKQDSDGDGIPDKKEQENNQGQQNKNQDTDNDGQPDYKDQDSDNDGHSDKQEAGENPSEPKDTDKDGTPDYRDLDSDNDGTPDSEEKPENQNKDQQQQQQQQQQQTPEDQMSKEDAQRLLNAIQQDENELQKKLRKAKAAKQTKTEKNW